MLNDLIKDFKLNRLGYNDEAVHSDKKIESVLLASITQVENVLKRAIIYKQINASVQFNGGFASLSPAPKGGLVVINGANYYTDEYGELYLNQSINLRLMCAWEAGYTNKTDIPYDILEAVYKLAAHLFTHDGSAMNRNNVGGSARSSEMINNPLKDSGAYALLNTYLRNVF